MLVKEGNHAIHPVSAQAFAPKAMAKQSIMSVHFGDRDNGCPLTTERTISVNMLYADGHARQFVIFEILTNARIEIPATLLPSDLLISHREMRALWCPAFK